MTSKTCTQSATVGLQLPVIPFYFTAKKAWSYNIVHYRQYIASTAAAKKCPLSYQTPQSVHKARNCGAQTLPLTMHYGGKKLGKNWGRNGRILTPTNSILYDLGSRLWCKVSSKLSENCDRRRGDTQTDRQTDRRDGRGWFYNLSHAML